MVRLAKFLEFVLGGVLVYIFLVTYLECKLHLFVKARLSQCLVVRLGYILQRVIDDGLEVAFGDVAPIRID
jgi:hypothetical protein